MARNNSKIGDIFEAKLETGKKKFFQYVGNDLTQLNSDVIRCFRNEYLLSDDLDLGDLVGSPVQFYAHCVIKWGTKMGLWVKVGNNPNIGTTDILFRDSDDYGHMVGEVPVLFSENWRVWRINEEFQHVGQLDEEERKAFVGLVFNPLGIMELMNGRRYPVNYPTPV